MKKHFEQLIGKCVDKDNPEGHSRIGRRIPRHEMSDKGLYLGEFHPLETLLFCTDGEMKEYCDNHIWVCVEEYFLDDQLKSVYDKIKKDVKPNDKFWAEVTTSLGRNDELVGYRIFVRLKDMYGLYHEGKNAVTNSDGIQNHSDKPAATRPATVRDLRDGYVTIPVVEG